MRIFRHFAQASNPCIATIGNYDGIHLGHQSLINHVISESRAKHLGPSVVLDHPNTTNLPCCKQCCWRRSAIGHFRCQPEVSPAHLPFSTESLANDGPLL